MSSKPVMGQRWMDALGLKEKDLQENQNKPMIFATIRALVVSFVLYHFIYFVDAFYADNSWLESSLMTSLFAGVGLVAVSLKMHDLFEGKPKQAMVINIGFEVVNFILVGLVIGLIAN